MNGQIEQAASSHGNDGNGSVGGWQVSSCQAPLPVADIFPVCVVIGDVSACALSRKAPKEDAHAIRHV